MELFYNVIFFLVFVIHQLSAQQPEAATTNGKVAIQQPMAKSADLQQQPEPRGHSMFPASSPGQQSAGPQRSSNVPADMNQAFGAERSTFNHNMARLGGTNGGNIPFPGQEAAREPSREPSRSSQRQSQSQGRLPTGADRASSSPARSFNEGSNSRSPISMNMERPSMNEPGFNLDFRGGPSPFGPRQMDFALLPSQQSLLTAASLRNLEQALQARAALSVMGLGMGPRAFDFRPNGNTDFAASQTDPVATYNRPLYPSPRQDSGVYRGYDLMVPQFRRPDMAGPGPEPYAAQFPFASSESGLYAGPEPSPKAALAYPKPLKAIVVLTSQFGITGIFNFSQTAVDQPVEIIGRVNGLRPGDHGIHIHSFGDLSRGCETAGPHFNPEGNHHGSPDDVQYQAHAGDLGNIYVPDYGAADFSITTPLISLYPPAPTLVVGRTLVIHEKPDDLGRGGDQTSRETGNSGARLACGIIGVSH
ncbi:SOD_CuZN9 [Ramazzottius varieornatus]|uniref:superoxide dismutase n=1 Tax=Ramazzottius varieornatus TaxID=947166 RepID=A0A1D1W3Y1_RAMVA|nr:SOD_CuZN9 [Ramazzottius varieornatus]